ncbi:HNH endonuclease [Georgenia satyanarayanai]|uniref:HNH endonuclease n=1 Tax=Georgenia satyanarayanai TaxID=860221 RepID=UPI001264DF1A|nr:HNH endonuclease signature motif containing protein [Georgenia satyanarayanai]
MDDDGAAPNGERVPSAVGSGPAGPLTVAALASWRAVLGEVDRAVTDAERVDLLRALEELKSAACAAQARISVDLDASQRAEQARAGVPLARRGAGVGAQVALARRESPHRGGRLLGLAKALVVEMPHTYRALQAGLLSEWRATLIVRESACLSVEDRTAFDAELAADPGQLDGLGDGQLLARAKKVAYRLDAASVVRRARKAESERCVSLRPAPDTMSYLTGLLPVAQGVAVLAALTKAADSARAQGDQRSRGQVMADTLVERVTGQESADAVPVEVQLVMTDRTLLAGDDEPATIPGYGTVPAGWASRLVARRLGAPGLEGVGRATQVWLRRLFTSPSTGQLARMDSRRRTVPPGLARFIATRDQTCRTPWCDAPVRHADHIVPWSEGGRTEADGLEGYCEACNYAKQAPGWRTRAGPSGGEDGHVVETTSPTGHRYRSRAPALPGHHSPDEGERDSSPAERYLLDLHRVA